MDFITLKGVSFARAFARAVFIIVVDLTALRWSLFEIFDVSYQLSGTHSSPFNCICEGLGRAVFLHFDDDDDGTNRFSLKRAFEWLSICRFALFGLWL